MNLSDDKTTTFAIGISAQDIVSTGTIGPAFTPNPYRTVDLKMTWHQLNLAIYTMMQEIGCTGEEVGKALVAIAHAYDRRHQPDPIVDTYHEGPEDNFTDAEADANTLASAGHGMDEDYGSAEDVL